MKHNIMEIKIRLFVHNVSLVPASKGLDGYSVVFCGSVSDKCVLFLLIQCFTKSYFGVC